MKLFLVFTLSLLLGTASANTRFLELISITEAKEILECVAHDAISGGNKHCESCVANIEECAESCIDPEDPICWYCIAKHGIECALCGHSLWDWFKACCGTVCAALHCGCPK